MKKFLFVSCLLVSSIGYGKPALDPAFKPSHNLRKIMRQCTKDVYVRDSVPMKTTQALINQDIKKGIKIEVVKVLAKMQMSIFLNSCIIQRLDKHMI